MSCCSDIASLSHDELAAQYLALHEHAKFLEEQNTHHEKNISSLEAKNTRNEERITELHQLNDWLKKQLFGKKSERRLQSSHSSSHQLSLGEEYEPEDTPPPSTEPVKSYERRRRKNEVEFTEENSKLQFDDTVPQQVVHVPNPATEGLTGEEYEVIGEEVAYKLAQTPGSYVVLKYVRPKVRVKTTGAISVPPVPRAARVIERGIGEVSFMAGLLLDKFLYHLPLHRQHQRLTASGIRVNRMTLTNLVHRAAQMLEPVYVSQQSSILLSKVLAIDETPIKAGRKVRGKMHQGQLWGMYGDKDELAFLYAPTRSGKVVRELLEDFSGTAVTDGYSAYERHLALREDVVHAQCWVHTRRKFIDAGKEKSPLAERALDLIGELYRIEETYSRKERTRYAEPVVEEFFSWLKETFEKEALLPSNLFTKAASYALKREQALRVFLKAPDVPLDTNHLERQIRPVAIGKKNWMFHWTEVGAQYGAIIQSLIGTCKLQGVDPYTYFVDVLQRIETHPMREVDLLTPRLWKGNFAEEPYTSDLKRAV